MEKNLNLKFQSIAQAFTTLVDLPPVLKKAGEKLTAVETKRENNVGIARNTQIKEELVEAEKAIADCDATRRKIWSAVLGVPVESIKYSRTIFDRITKRFSLTEAKATELQKASALHGGGRIEAADCDALENLLETL